MQHVVGRHKLTSSPFPAPAAAACHFLKKHTQTQRHKIITKDNARREATSRAVYNQHNLRQDKVCVCVCMAVIYICMCVYMAMCRC